MPQHITFKVNSKLYSVDTGTPKPPLPDILKYERINPEDDAGLNNNLQLVRKIHPFLYKFYRPNGLWMDGNGFKISSFIWTEIGEWVEASTEIGFRVNNEFW